MNQKSGVSRRSSRQPFTEKQGEYLAFIYVYSHMFQRPPAETDMQRYFRVSPPSVHQMVLTLKRVRPDSPSARCRPKHRTPRPPRRTPHPQMAQNQPVKSSVTRYLVVLIHSDKKREPTEDILRRER